MTDSHASARARAITALSAGFSVIASVVLYVAWSPHVALGFAGGVVTGAGMLSALVFVINRALVPPQQETRGPAVLLLMLHVGKFGAAAALAWVVIKVWNGSAGGFVVGYTLALAVLIIIIGGEPTSVQLPEEDDDTPQ